ncbi:NAD(P)-binding protein [Lindgomyces ingoldianus]|uniref:NAD(P)-binding protein n=1 Tax=Lindgomyces ingoldianus TaxID=673940 RepID=A0ACB6RCW5_9PLEO|nr:NAD(P)-binding protein [Lindgomyces ingoldianus]KAF2476895.1 NAD(P)-binding protein [Lindgomyces ingoldianus]
MSANESAPNSISSNPRLEDKVSIVTGAGSGSGAGILSKFLSEGCRGLIWDHNPNPVPLSSLLAGQVQIFTADVSDPSSWPLALPTCLPTFDKFDILTNNAGVVHVANPNEDVPEEEVDRVLRVNVKPLYFSAGTVVPYWSRKGEGGVVLNLSSTSAPRPRLRLATRGLAPEVAPVLGDVDTPEGRAIALVEIPIGRICTPKILGDAACFLASDEAALLTVNFDGGRSLM